MPTIEHFRKQAKLRLRWHRDAHYPVAQQIRSFLVRYHGLSDREILEREFKLGDAQELVARQHGFENWQALKKGIDAMSAPDVENERISKPVLALAEPQLFVADIKASCDFYAEKLGFEIKFVYGEPSYYGQVARGGARLNFRRVEAPLFDPLLRSREDLLSATVIVDHAKALFLEYQARGATFHQTLRTEPWGARTFIVSDPDGNLIAFSSDQN